MTVALAAMLAACGGSSSPAVNARGYIGTWKLDVDANPPCWGAGTLLFAIDDDDASVATRDAMTVVSSWWFESLPNGKEVLTGTVDFKRNTFTFAMERFGRTAHFYGNDPTATKLVGEFYDPDEMLRHGTPCTNPRARATAARLSQ
jgi:hypothetical protein